MSKARIVGCGIVFVLGMLSGCARSPQARKEKFIAKGNQFLQKRDYTRALLEFRNAAKAVPHDAEPFYYLGLAFTGGGDLNNAALSFRKALELDPKYSKAKLRLAEVMATAADLEFVQNAEKSISELMETTPGSPEMLDALAIAELRLGQTEDAVNNLEQALKMAPGELRSSLVLAKVKLMQRDAKGAEEILKTAAAAAPSIPEPLLALARLYMSQNRLAEAEQAIRHALQVNPKSANALRELAIFENATGRKKEAEEHFKQLSGSGQDAYKPIYAYFLFSEGRRDEAVREFERAAKQDPDDRAARNRLVLAYQAVKRTADARKTLDAALKKNPRDMDALLQRAHMLMAEGQYAEAEMDLNRVLGQKPDSAEARYAVAKVHQAQGQPLQYRQDLFKALELNPLLLAVRVELAGALINYNQAQDALTVLNQAPAAQQRSLAVIAQRNWALWATGDLQEMRKGIDLGLSRARSTEFLAQDGLWKLRMGNAAAARASLEEALKIDPGDLRALTALKDSYILQRQAPAAVQKIKEYAAQQPKSAAVQDFLGFVMWGSGDRVAARTAFTAATAADPKYYPADLALVQLDALDGNWDDATLKLNGLLAANPGNATARLWLGTIQAIKGNPAAALENFRKVVEISPDNSQALNNFAYLLSEHANKPDEALKYAEKAVEEAPTNANYADTLGWILYRKGLYSQALSNLERAVSTGRSPVAKYHLAMAYAKAGDLQRGRVTLAAAIKQNSKLPEARMAAEVLGPVK